MTTSTVKTSTKRTALDLIVILLAGVVCLSAIGGIVVAGLASPRPWFFLGFEVAVLVAGVFGVLTGMGRFRDAPGMALLCVAGAVGMASLFGYLGSGKQIHGVSLAPLLAGRLGAMAVLLLVAGWMVLRRRPAATLPVLLKGLAMMVPLMALSAGLYLGWGKIKGLGVPVPLLAVLAVIVASVLLGLLAASVHLTIKAFEIGRDA